MNLFRRLKCWSLVHHWQHFGAIRFRNTNDLLILVKEYEQICLCYEMSKISEFVIVFLFDAVSSDRNESIPQMFLNYLLKFTILVAVVTPTERSKSVRNRFVTSSVFVLSLFCWCKAFVIDWVRFPLFLYILTEILNWRKVSFHFFCPVYFQVTLFDNVTEKNILIAGIDLTKLLLKAITQGDNINFVAFKIKDACSEENHHIHVYLPS